MIPGRLLLLLVLVLVQVSCATGQDDKELTRFHGPEFSILLPGRPTISTVPVPGTGAQMSMTFYLVESGDDAVAVATAELPLGLPFNLDDAVGGAAAQLSGEVVESETVEANGVAARDARISAEQEGHDVTVFLRVFVSGGTLFQVQQVLVGKDVEEPPSSYRQILDSLELV